MTKQANGFGMGLNPIMKEHGYIKDRLTIWGGSQEYIYYKEDKVTVSDIAKYKEDFDKYITETQINKQPFRRLRTYSKQQETIKEKLKKIMQDENKVKNHKKAKNAMDLYALDDNGNIRIDRWSNPITLEKWNEIQRKEIEGDLL
jgi:hypothetical protein